ncbi:pyridoxal phosphate-dependent transferase [Chytridium lagenaria]|nr:pyridoxal phosphate-dependent transferase [Chytridium lagenaria]
MKGHSFRLIVLLIFFGGQSFFQVTTPTAAMWERMRAAPVGDDVMEEDPTVKQLEAKICELTKMEASMFCASGTMSNQIGIRTHLTSPPHSVLCDVSAHIYVYEAGGIAFHSQATVIPVHPKPGFRHLTADAVNENLILTDDVHYAPTKLVCLENTMEWGDGVKKKKKKVLPMEHIREISKLARSHGLYMHLDGARLWNACMVTGTPLHEYATEFDSMSLCLSKGLGAPIGSVLVGKSAYIKKARHFRKLFGGGWRQAGVLAAAGLYAIEHHWEGMRDDHVRAKRLASGLERLGFRLTRPCESNMVWIDAGGVRLKSGGGGSVWMDVSKILLDQASTVIPVWEGMTECRLVVHHQTDDECVDRVLSVLKENILL